MKKFILILIVTSMFVASKKVDAQVTEQDSLALVAFYNATDGPNWTNKTNWLNGQVSTWAGITVVNGRVYTFRLYSNNIKGSIPSEIGELTQMNFLELGDNQLSGNIPSEIAQLVSLKTLDLSQNQLSGAITTAIGTLTNLTQLSLWENMLTGNIPSEIGEMVNLTELNLRNNQLTGNIPSSIWESSLNRISLGNNQLTGAIPSEIGQLTNLTSLGLSNNQFSGDLPQELGLLTKMDALELNGNEFTGTIPAAIAQWQNFFVFDLQNNNFSNLPDLSAMPYVKPNVNNNRFEFDDLEPNVSVLGNYSPQDSIGDAETKIINLGEQLVVSITTGGTQNSYKWFKNNTEIIGQENAALTISNTVLLDAGVYHAEVKNRLLRNLTLIGRPTKVNIDDPGLIADSLALVQLLVSTGGFQWNNATNWLEGPVSTWYGVTVTNGRVSQLDLSNNNLTGSIPLEILKMSKLTFLSLENNKIKNLPNLSNLPLTGLSVENNKLEFDDIEPNISIPLFTYWPQDSIGVAQELNLSVFAELSLSITAGGTRNRYKWFKDGNLIPNLISGIDEASIRYPVVLPSNAGVYHAEVSNLLVPNLILLGRSTSVKIQNPVVTADSLALVAFYNATDGPNWKNNSNWLNGPVSTWYGVEVEPYFRRVGVLKLPRNFLKGTIPPEIIQLEELQYLNLSVNDLTGTIPRGILQLWRLRIFNVKENRLSGFSANLAKSGVVNNIPPEIGNLTELEFLDLGSNLFTGVLPPEIGKLTKLKFLNVGINQLSGSLPLEIGDLTSLDTLNLGSNNFTGELPLSMVNMTNLTFFNFDSTQLVVPNDTSFQNWLSDVPEVVTAINKLENTNGTIPNEFALKQNYPNPFNPTTTIQYSIPHHGGQANVASGLSLRNVQLKIYDLLGREVVELVNENQSPGNYEVRFDASNLTSGIYFYRLQAGSFTKIKKMLLMK